MTEKTRHSEGVYRRSIKRNGRSVTVYDAVHEGPRVEGRRQKVWRRGFAGQREAIAWRDAQRVGVRSGGYVAPDRITVAQYLDEWLPSIKASVRRSTFESYAMHARVHLKPRIGDVRLQALTVERVSKLYADLLDSGLSAASVRRIHSTLRRSLRDARRSGRVVKNPAEDARLPQVRTPDLNVWDAPTARRFLDYLSTRDDEQVHTLFSLMIGTGARRGEVLGLGWSEVDLDHARLRVVRTLVSVNGRIVESEPKTKRSRRTIGLDERTVALLRRHRVRQIERRVAWGEAWAETDLVFDDGRGGPLHPDAVSKSFAKLAREAGVPLIRLHDLRHSAATLMLSAGVPAKVASERLGHSTIAITLDTYTAFVPALDADAAARTADLIYGSG